MGRLVALFVLAVPVIAAAYGIKWMRDMVFGIPDRPFSSLTLQFLAGFLLSAGGIAFTAGFILHRDRKHQKVQKRFSKPSK
ncbi:MULTISPECIES: DUF2627 domain-containing protein [Heyndrickxia]|uniref:DUF2627 domain-containing protein n=1 Tax=Heyndrickxia faecalis TaxID=2824910 RepID=A0AAU7WLA5_9BACI|nr:MULTISPECIES: DUF2627 domain-containing protein [Heyndrickxia]NWN94183.1 DUF2627 domain-containing protein [Bacillus sp. (in: firmicutes)]KGT40192.1 membrane protein [Heyndrickxia coagulans P38]MED4321819.1 DUF2627 domain-containing protein [Weizmannia sp. CD-2023]MED4892735.1 DUF2627 domain-containing protein [Weizmannia sp. CD-2023]MED4921704.1 DUF2627 domain-containing protein [Weizmannia sp. CD-2023]